jgi:hypothetical protein
MAELVASKIRSFHKFKTRSERWGDARPVLAAWPHVYAARLSSGNVSP